MIFDMTRLGACMNRWTPRTCRTLSMDPAARQRSPIDHMCMEWRGIPHICVCARCYFRNVWR